MKAGVEVRVFSMRFEMFSPIFYLFSFLFSFYFFFLSGRDFGEGFDL